ncbi:MAG: DUF4129 domain-containing protein [Candidatus Sulfopaludibacter sp.]|nr:DUF4129 domain-containing protein [Candidatus Sulfopaludibacter sp.]
MQSDALSLLEEAVHLLREAGFTSLVRHWTGSVPLAVAFLVCWNSVTGGIATDVQCVGGSLALALLLVWMHCRRAVFAGRLMRHLSGAPAVPWTFARAWRFTALQASLAATKPLALFIGLLVLFPFARVVAFYRSAAALGDRPDLDPRQIVQHARRLASLDFGQTWKLLPLLLLLLLAVFANITLTVAMLPQLVRILTGYESALSRSGQYFFQNPLFFVVVLVLTWLAFDPFVQAVYCVRCFYGESRETGEDIRVGLRLLRAPIPTAALLLAAGVFCARAADAVSAVDLQQSVRHAMQAPGYAWRIPPPAAKTTGPTPWIVTITDRMVNGLKNGLKELGRLIMKVLEWIFDRLGVQPNPQGGPLPSTGLHWSLYVLMAIILAVLAWAIYRRRLFQRRRAHSAQAEPVPVVRLEEEGLSAGRLPEEAWLELAAECLREEKLRLALRAFFLANLAWLGRLEFLSLDAAKTNREFELELRRRARPFPEARELFSGNVAGFERAWYGQHEVSRRQVEELREHSDGMKRILAPAARETAA